jgi:outer membrane protein TolC
MPRVRLIPYVPLVRDLRRKAASLLAWLACAAVLLGAARARADDLVLTRGEALRLGVERGPAVVEAKAPLGATGAVRESASAALPYVPRLSGFAGARRGDFGSGVEVGGSVVQELSLRGLGGARREAGAAFANAGLRGLERAKLEAGANALLAWIDVLEAQELVAQRARSREDAEAIARVARARVDRGVGMPLEASLASAEVGTADLAERDAEGMLFVARAELRLAVALPPTVPVRAVGTLDAADRSPRDAAHEHPTLAAARSETELLAADARLARSLATPTLGVGVAFTREGTGQQVFTGLLSLPLPFGDPTRFDAARHEAAVLASHAREGRIRAELARDLAVAGHEREHTREVYATLRDRILGPLREAVRVARSAYEAGTQDATTFLLLRQRLVTAEEQLQRASAEVLRADVRYAYAQGSLLDEEKR